MTAESLLDRTYGLLDSTDLTYREIATGASVDMNWLAKFKQRQIPEPGVKKVQRVHDFLVGRAATATPVPAGNANEQQHSA